jgi:hypothetical protein
MKKLAANGTPVYARQHSRTPTLSQLNAIDLLAAGKTDQETADLLKLHRTTVTKWRLYDPVFQAALNRRRAEVWGAAADRLQSLIPRALNVLGEVLADESHPGRLKAAIELLRLVPPTGAAMTVGPTEADEIVREIVSVRRNQAPDLLDGLRERQKGLPPLAEHVEVTWCELEALANNPAVDSPAAGATGAGLMRSTNS